MRIELHLNVKVDDFPALMHEIFESVDSDEPVKIVLSQGIEFTADLDAVEGAA